MEISYSLAQHTVPFWTPPEMVYNARILGYDTVGIRAIRQHIPEEGNWDLVQNKELRKATRRAIQETGISIHDMDLAMIGSNCRVENYEPALEAAADLGIRGVVASIWTDQVSFYLEQFAKLCDLAAEYQMAVHLEYVAWSSVSTFCQAKGILQIVGRPNAKILIDTLHQFCSGKDLSNFKSIPGSWIGLVHLCDVPKRILESREDQLSLGRTGRLYPGEGDADLKGILQELSEPIVCALEIPNTLRRTQLGACEYARRCIEKTKKWIKDMELE